MRYQAMRGVHPITLKGNRRIADYLKGKRGRRKDLSATPSQEKEIWALKTLRESSWDKVATTTRRIKTWVNPIRDVEEYQDIGIIKRRIQDWAQDRWIESWKRYQRGIPSADRSPAQQGDLFGDRLDCHKMLRKAESSIAIGLRSGKVGLNDFLYQMKVPGVRQACTCGWRRQDVKHLLLNCPELQEARPQLFDEAGTRDISQMLTTTKGIRAAARWIVKSGWFNSFGLAKEQLNYSRLPAGMEETLKPKKRRTKKGDTSLRR